MGEIIFIVIALLTLKAIETLVNSGKKAEDLICPVCGYYCLGKNARLIGCIDKPALVRKEKRGDDNG